MSHRKAGIRGIQNQQRQKETFQKQGQIMQLKQLEQIKEILETFKQNLEQFATKHAQEIKQNQEFRSKFQEMCSKVGVDPLASNKGFWTQLLGFGDFYYEVSVQVAQICIATREINGGFIEMDELKNQLSKLRGNAQQPISEDDILQSIKCLKPLGDGYSIIKLGTKTMIRSVPEELNTDHSSILELAEKNGHVSCLSCSNSLGWAKDRAQATLDSLLQQSIFWVDLQPDPPEYWISGFYF
jgi:ESCRT-II complex subunit VPS22